MIVLHDLEFTQLPPHSQAGCTQDWERSICGPFAGNKMEKSNLQLQNKPLSDRWSS